ncbi:hypothetical protein [Deinococcus ficus]|uniref:Uncharacterized protein n=1 Tax=Deinococcus ficus TaxID=317577 RepID=A0A221T2P9_9DEIO|nr:hypothetical protein [Deinococcus ficus]ASN83197.1 hypothetical protein DFI_18530 [Deinococcus ficus]
MGLIEGAVLEWMRLLPWLALLACAFWRYGRSLLRKDREELLVAVSGLLLGAVMTGYALDRLLYL